MCFSLGSVTRVKGLVLDFFSLPDYQFVRMKWEFDVEL